MPTSRVGSQHEGQKQKKGKKTGDRHETVASDRPANRVIVSWDFHRQERPEESRASA
jgi:hypothetical protein